MALSGRQINVGSLVARIIFRGDTAAIDAAQSRVTNLRRNLSGLSNTLAVTGTAVTGFSALSVREFAMQETAYAKLRGQVGLTAEEITELRPSIQGVASDFGLTEAAAADAFFTIASSGQRGERALDTLRISAQLSASEFGEIRSITTALIPVLAAYSSSNLTAAQAGDQFAAAVRLGNFEASQLARALPVVVSQAANIGVGTGDILAALASASRVQPRLTENATSLRQIFSALASPTTQAQAALARYGFTVEGITESLSTDFLGALTDLDVALDGNRIALREVLGSVEAVTGFYNILGGEAEDTRMIFEQVNAAQGDLATTFDAFSGTTALETRMALAEMRDGLAQLGATMLPIFLEIKNAVLPIIRSFTALLSEGNPVVVALVRVLAVLGPALIAAAVALRAFNVVLGITNILAALNPIGAIVLGVVALGAALAVVVVYWEQIWGFVRDVANTIRSIGSTIFGGGGSNQVPGFQDGGIVPGRIGEPLAAIVHGGELIVPAPAVSRYREGGSRLSVGDINVNMTFNGGVANAEEIGDIVAVRVRTELEREMRKIDASAPRGF